MLLHSDTIERAPLECDRLWVRARSGQTKEYKIGICCFSAKHTALRKKSKKRLNLVLYIPFVGSVFLYSNLCLLNPTGVET
jgi:hypothetical protein